MKKFIFIGGRRRLVDRARRLLKLHETLNKKNYKNANYDVYVLEMGIYRVVVVYSCVILLPEYLNFY